MVKYSKKSGKKGNVNIKIQSRKRAKKAGKRVTRVRKVGRDGNRARIGSLRSAKSIMRKKKQKIQIGKGGDDDDDYGSIGKIYAFYDVNTNDFLLSFVELPLAENEDDPATISGQVLYRAFADKNLQKIIDDAANKNKTDGDGYELDTITLPNDFDFLELVSKEQDRIIDLLDKDKDKVLNGGSFNSVRPSSESEILYTSAKSRRSGLPPVKTHNEAMININITQLVYEHFKKQLRLTDEWIKTQKLIDKIRENPGGKLKQLKATFFVSNTMKLSVKQENDIDRLRYKLDALKEEIKIGLPDSLKFIKAYRLPGDDQKTICYPDNSQDAKIDGRVTMASIFNDTSLWNIMLSFYATLENRLKELESGKFIYSKNRPKPALPPDFKEKLLPPRPGFYATPLARHMRDQLQQQTPTHNSGYDYRTIPPNLVAQTPGYEPPPQPRSLPPALPPPPPPQAPQLPPRTYRNTATVPDQVSPYDVAQTVGLVAASNSIHTYDLASGNQGSYTEPDSSERPTPTPRPRPSRTFMGYDPSQLPPPPSSLLGN